MAGLIDALDLGERRVAVAINRDVVPRSRFGTYRLQPDDRVEILPYAELPEKVPA